MCSRGYDSACSSKTDDHDGTEKTAFWRQNLSAAALNCAARYMRRLTCYTNSSAFFRTHLVEYQQNYVFGDYCFESVSSYQYSGSTVSSISFVKIQRLNWLDYVLRTEDSRTIKRLYEYFSWPRCLPRSRRRDSVLSDVKQVRTSTSFAPPGPPWMDDSG